MIDLTYSIAKRNIYFYASVYFTKDKPIIVIFCKKP